MRLILRSILIMLLASLLISAQKAEKPPIELTEDLLSPTNSDILRAESESLEVFKILPRGMFGYEKNALDLRGGGAFYSFTKKSHSYNETPQISLDQNYLTVGFYGASYGLIADLGQTSPELAKFRGETDFLLKYAPPKLESEIRAEARKARDYQINGMQFKRRVPVTVGNTYLLRAITFREADTLVSFRIERRNEDGSLIIFWNKLKDFETPVLFYHTDEALAEKVRGVLREKGFNRVTFQVKDNVVTLRGAVPRGKMGEAIMAVNSLRPHKIENQLSIE